MPDLLPVPTLDPAPPIYRHLFPDQVVADYTLRSCPACPYVAFHYAPDGLDRRAHVCPASGAAVTWEPPHEAVEVTHHA